MKKFDVGARVVIKTHVEAYPNPNAGTVIAHTDGERSHVVEFAYGSCSKVNPADLITEEEAKTLRAEVEAARAKLEAEFDGIRGSLQEKLNQAADLIREARDLATSHRKDLASLYSETSDLVDVLSDVGWITSNSNC